MNEQEIQRVIGQVMEQLKSRGGPAGKGHISGTRTGIFSDINDAVAAAKEAQYRLGTMKLEIRGRLIDAIRAVVEKNVELIARTSVEETGLGKYEDKVQKNLLAARKTPGIEDVRPRA